MDRERKWVDELKKTKDKDCAEKLIKKYYREIYAFMYRQCANVDDAMDLTQDTFTSFLQAIDAYDPEKCKVRTWLYRIAANRVIDFRRTRHSFDIDIDELEIPEEIDRIRQSEQRTLLKEIDAYVSKLNDESENIVRMRLYENLSFAEIGEALGISEGSSKMKFHRMIEKIRKQSGDMSRGDLKSF